jgi:LysM repeat protein
MGEVVKKTLPLIPNIKEGIRKIIRDLKPKVANKGKKDPNRIAIAEKRFSDMVEKGQIKTDAGYGRTVATVQGSIKPRKGRLSKKTQKPVYGRMRKSMNPDKFKGIEKKVKKANIRRAATKVVAGGSAATLAALLSTLLGTDEDKSSSVTIKKGDTLSQIAKDNGTTLKALKESNPNIKDLNKIRIGQKINLSPKVKNRKSVYQGMSKSDMASISKDKVVSKKHGGQIGTPRGVGAALRGYGKGYK